MEVLEIVIRGECFLVDSKGKIKSQQFRDFSDTWLFKGVSTHHWHNRVTIPFNVIWENPQKAINGFFWDIDHGTVRCWGGCYNGKLPRVESCRKYKLEYQKQ